MESIQELIEKLEIGSAAVALRRELHMHPELSEHEHETMNLICRKLRELNIPFEKNVADTGVVGLIEGGFDGPCVGLRADIDALPIEEMTDQIDFISRNPGVMHACGHDAHAAILWGAAAALNSIKNQLHGSVKLFFQPAEETIGGAERMIAEGWLENPHVDYMLGLHVAPDLPAGKVGLKYGKVNAASDMLTLKIYGSSCHGAHPNDGVDAILIAAQILNNVQSFVSRNVSPTDAAVVSFGTIHGGNVRNQIADYVELTGIIRTLDPETRLYARERVKTICEQTALMNGGQAELIIEPSYSPLINTDSVVDVVKASAQAVVGGENIVVRKEASLGVEDFAYFAAARPSCFFHLGCGAEDDPKSRYLHSCYFRLDESCIPIGIEMQVKNVLSIIGA